MSKVKIVERVEELENARLVIEESLDNKLDTRPIDEYPLLASEGLVTSDGIYKALLKKQDTLVIDYQLSSSSQNPISNSAVTNAVDLVNREIDRLEAKVDIGYTKGMQVFTSSGLFIVPQRVNSVKVTCIGSGGTYLVNGNTTSFGNYLYAYGGGLCTNQDGGFGGGFKSNVGGYGYNGGNGSKNNDGYQDTYYGGASYIFAGAKIESLDYGRGGNMGGGAGSIVAIVSGLTSGESIPVIVGAPVSYQGYNVSGGGVCVVEW